MEKSLIRTDFSKKNNWNRSSAWPQAIAKSQNKKSFEKERVGVELEDLSAEVAYFENQRPCSLSWGGVW